MARWNVVVHSAIVRGEPFRGVSCTSAGTSVITDRKRSAASFTEAHHGLDAHDPQEHA